ncbi:LysR family transcriptional regulator [Hymenobacter terrenus]|uniref:LysR family transcriptional regulator n=1 Tax=Hymenobacter terrenus TaxID=1629124 RepID=UPI0006191E89|nr:LysR family transcriptional regulator [Hymenobacter terrenus]
MEIRHLRLVRAIVEEGSMARAIDKLHLTPSALSHQLKEAELQLGAPIFYRINKKMVLTPVGEKVLDAAHTILAEWSRAEAEIKELIGGEKGVISLSTECYTSYHWLPGVMKRFARDFPYVQICIDFEATTNPIPRLLSGCVDVVVTNTLVVDPNIEFIDLFSDELLVLVPVEHAWASRPYVVAEDFADETLIIYSRPLSSVVVYEQLFGPAGVEPGAVSIVPLTEASVELVKAGLGVKVMPSWAAKHYLHSGQIKAVRVGAEGLFLQYYAARLRNKDYPLYFECFLNTLRQEILVH